MAANQQTAFEKFISTRKILVADESSSSRTGVTVILGKMGAKPHLIHMANSIHAAEEIIQAQKPDIVLAEYNFGKSSGLELLQSQRAVNPDSKKSIFVLLTGNTSQSAVARAAEEDVDAFLLKPFTPEVLKQTLMKAALLKVQPPPYLLEIDAGKALLEKGDLDGAEKTFTNAKSLDPKPSLALYYLGQIEYIRKALSEAEGDYEQGLAFSRIHYKCLVGMYELMQSMKKHESAYEVVKKLSQYFPANPKRLTEVLRLAIINKQYDDVEKYYQVFCNIDARNETLINYICAALVVCGKYYLQGGNRARALELYQKAAATSAGRTKIIREIVLALVENKLGADAGGYLERYPQGERSTPEFKALEFEVLSAMTPDPRVVIERGREILSRGAEHPRIYEILIARSVEAGKKDFVENFLSAAIGKFPNEKARFEAVQSTGKLAKAG